MKKTTFLLSALFLMFALSNCTEHDYRYVDLNTGNHVNIIKDSVTGTMVNSETKQPVTIYYDTQTKDTIYGTTGEVINNKVVKTSDGKYTYVVPVVPVKTEVKEKVLTQDEIDRELLKNGNYKKKVEKDGDIKIKHGDTKIKYDAETGEKKIKQD